MQIHNKKEIKPSPASTVILVREYDCQLEVYLLKRSSKSGFMAGNYVFPGGMVDEEDRNFQFWKDHVDLDEKTMAQKLGGNLKAEEALAFSIAAIRETLEEAGIFLAQRTSSKVGDWEHIQKLRLSPNLSVNWFQELAIVKDWVLALSELYPWSHWITPEKMKRRFDTRFFLAVMPADQVCRPDDRETTHGLWISPRQGLRDNMSGKIPLSPPTLITLHSLLAYRNLQDLIKKAEKQDWGKPIRPRLVPLDKGAVIIEPWDSMYDSEEIKLDNDLLAKALLAVGEPFSRIWYNKGIWRPVKG